MMYRRVHRGWRAIGTSRRQMGTIKKNPGRIGMVESMVIFPVTRRKIEPSGTIFTNCNKRLPLYTNPTPMNIFKPSKYSKKSFADVMVERRSTTVVPVVEAMPLQS